MGLCFYYHGSFNPAASLPDLIQEVEEIALANQWKYYVFEKSFPSKAFGDHYDENIYGICFTPPECETVHLAFLSNGKMSSFTNLKFYGNEQESSYPEYLYMLSVKTQYAGVEVHIALMKLLKYISQKYLLDFELHDEGQYWETEDETVLRNIFSRYENLIHSFKVGLQTIPIKEGESPEEYIKRIANQIKQGDVDIHKISLDDQE